MAANEDYTLNILQETGLVTPAQIERARAERKPKDAVTDALIRQGVISQEDLMRALATHAAMDFVDLAQVAIPDEVIGMVPSEVAKRFKVVPIAQSDSGLMLAVSDPLNFDTFDAVAHVLQRDVEWVCATPEQISISPPQILRHGG